MLLEELNLNRFLYKTSTPGLDTSLFSGLNAKDMAGSSGMATSVASGSVITSSILQSSPSDNRIEINPDDTLRAYNSKRIVVQIDKNGISIFPPGSADGTRQPVLYTGDVDQAGNMVDGPAGWTSTFIFLGFYRITHNLNLSTPYRVFIETKNGFRLISEYTTSSNSFDVSFIDDTGGTGTGDFSFLVATYLPN